VANRVRAPQRRWSSKAPVGSVSNALAAPKPSARGPASSNPKTKKGTAAAKKEMTAKELADALAPVFRDLSGRASGNKWTNKERKDWDRAARLLQKARGRTRRDPL
jgi:hypothetical protein